MLSLFLFCKQISFSDFFFRLLTDTTNDCSYDIFFLYVEEVEMNFKKSNK